MKRIAYGDLRAGDYPFPGKPKYVFYAYPVKPGQLYKYVDRHVDLTQLILRIRSLVYTEV